MHFLIKELRASPWNSKTQLILASIIIYFCAVWLGPYYGCGAGLTNYEQGSFSCKGAEMALAVKMKILAMIVFASLCFGRAMALHSKQKTAYDRASK